MSATSFRNPANGYVEEVHNAGPWCLLFGSLYFAAKGVWTHAAISLVLAFVTFGISWLIYPFFAQRIVETNYLRKGWQRIEAPSRVAPRTTSFKAGYDFARTRRLWLFGGASILIILIGSEVIVGYQQPQQPTELTSPAVTSKSAQTSQPVDVQSDTGAKSNQRASINRGALVGLTRKRDAVEGVDFYSVGSLTTNPGSFWALYIGVPDQGTPYLNFRFQYTTETWMFIRSVTLNVDGEKLVGPEFNYAQVKRQAGAGMIWESYDETVHESAIPFFQRISRSKNTIIRYEGDQTYRDQILSGADKAAMIKVLTAYARLNQ